MTKPSQSQPEIRCAALLRAVNTGGRKVKMAELREALAAAGFDAPTTLLASGNVVLDVPPEDMGELAPRLEELIRERFGLHSDVIVRDHASLAQALAAHPFRSEEDDRARLHVVFLRDVPEPSLVAAMDPDRSPPDRFAVLGSEIHVHYPNGAGRSKLTLDWFERQLGTVGTARNLNTVEKLAALAAPQG